MKLLYWLDEWLTLSRKEQETRLPISGEDLLDDVFVKYEFVDLNKPLLFTFSPAGTNLQVLTCKYKTYIPISCLGAIV